MKDKEHRYLNEIDIQYINKDLLTKEENDIMQVKLQFLKKLQSGKIQGKHMKIMQLVDQWIDANIDTMYVHDLGKSNNANIKSK